MSPPLLSPPICRHTFQQLSTTAQVGLIAVIYVGRAAEVDRESEVNRVVTIKTSAAIPTPPLFLSFQHCIIHIISPTSPHRYRRGSTTSTTVYIAYQ